jgi:hypothetical protein
MPLLMFDACRLLDQWLIACDNFDTTDKFARAIVHGSAPDAAVDVPIVQLNHHGSRAGAFALRLAPRPPDTGDRSGASSTKTSRFVSLLAS